MTTNKLFRHISLGIFSVFALFAAGCEDSPPNSYTQEYVVQSVLIVDSPITGVIVQRSLPVTDTFSMKNAIVRDADVSITDSSGREFVLQFRDGGSYFGDYAFPDTTVKIQPNTVYKLRVRMKDGKTLTGETRTPKRFSWIVPPRQVLQFPQDTLNLPSPDSLKLVWTAESGSSEYLIRVTCLDTLGYGKYLTPQTDELNRRRKRFFDNEDDPFYYNRTERYGFVQTTDVRTVWTAFKWYGRNTVSVLAGDANLIRWYKLYFQNGNQYDPYLGSIKGGIGMFGSASQVSQETFILKNQK